MNFFLKRKGKENEEVSVALAGNPNVGKSTLFNTLTGMHRHTGNWAGKTVSGEFCTEKEVKTGRAELVIVAGDASENTKKKIKKGASIVSIGICSVNNLSREKLLNLLDAFGTARLSFNFDISYFPSLFIFLV